MNVDDFRWKGVLASTMGVLVTEQVGYTRPQETVERVVIPGRNGSVTPLGARTFNEVVYSPGCAVKPGADLDAIRTWLRGDGAVIFGSMPDYAFDATLESSFEMRPYVDGDFEGWTPFQPVFTCQPYRYRAETPGKQYTDMQSVAAGGSKVITIENAGNVEALPIIETITNTGPFTITLNGVSFTVEGVTGGFSFDSEAQVAYRTSNNGSIMNKMTGDFPTLAPGTNYMTVKLGDGVTMKSVYVTKNERWL